MDLLPTNAKLGRIMRILEINIWLFETLFVLSIHIFEGQYFLYEGCKLIAFHMSLQCLSMLIYTPPQEIISTVFDFPY